MEFLDQLATTSFSIMTLFHGVYLLSLIRLTVKGLNLKLLILKLQQSYNCYFSVENLKTAFKERVRIFEMLATQSTSM